MTNSAQSSKVPSRLRPRPALAFAILFAFLGFADAIYLAADHYLVLPLPCSASGGCELVLNSPYATLGPLPIAVLGAAYYLLSLLILVYVYTSEYLEAARKAKLAVWVLSGLGLLSSAFLIYLQLAVIQAICLYCMGSALTTLLLFISVSFLNLRKYQAK